jgi:hypothetical protein
MLRAACIFAALLMVPALVQAQNIAQDAGPFDLTLGGTGTTDKNVHNGGGSLAGGFGWFFTPNFEVSVRDSASYNDFGTGHTWSNEVRGALDFNLNFDRFQPFVGANVGYLDGNIRRGTGEAAPEAGLKFFLNNTTYLYGTIEYNFLFNNSDTTISNGQFAYGVGIGVRF